MRKELINDISKFYKDIERNNNSRYKSWEHCYSIFVAARKEKSPNIDLLSLNLAFYLASWGMYRGSSFLLQRDYKIHYPAVKIILRKEYDSLLGISVTKLKDDSNLDKLMKLSDELDDYYKKIRKSVNNKEVNKDISSILITKVLLGTLGCAPAYDQFFTDAIRKFKVASGNYNKQSILSLINFYEASFVELEKQRKKMKIDKIYYPQMKVLDMMFWQYGCDHPKRK